MEVSSFEIKISKHIDFLYENTNFQITIVDKNFQIYSSEFWRKFEVSECVVIVLTRSVDLHNTRNAVRRLQTRVLIPRHAPKAV